MKRRDRDTHYMAVALRLAAKARGLTSPNPMVGAIVVADGVIVGKGYHRRAGEPHAEVLALRDAGARALGATLYVTLEPCAHTNKRTPPCVPSIVRAGVRRVVVAMPDPNPLVRGRGLRQLRQRGLRVDVGCLHSRAEHLNEAYCHWVTTGRPLTTMKAAITLDGKIATASGESRWITGAQARRHVHQQRQLMDAVLVGIDTVLQDDPELTVRKPGRRPGLRQPLRVVLDSHLRIPPGAKMLRRAQGVGTGPLGRGQTLIATTRDAPTRRLRKLRARGVPVVVLPKKGDRVSLSSCLSYLGRHGITTVMIEGGSEVHASALQAGLVNRVLFYVAPILMGGRDARGVIGGTSPRRLGDAWPLQRWSTRWLGRDLLIEGTVDPRGRAQHRA